MRKLLLASLAALPLAVAGSIIYANAVSQGEQPKPAKQAKASTSGYICPLTGEELPCPNCCPLNQKKK
jgi:hypothetical protein